MDRLPTLGRRGEGWVVLQGLLLAVAGLGGVIGLASPAWSGPVRVVTSLAGGALMAVGAWGAWRGARDLGRNLTPLPHPTATGELIETGVYRHVRHPIYGGVIVATAGWGLFAAAPVAVVVAVLLVPFFWAKSSLEERWLEGRFPGYAMYRRRTRRFIPWIC